MAKKSKKETAVENKTSEKSTTEKAPVETPTETTEVETTPETLPVLSEEQALRLRVQLLEHEVASLKTIVHEILGMVPRRQSEPEAETTTGKTKPGKKRLSKDEKAALKLELLAGCPYTEAELLEIGTSKLRMLCAALKVNSFSKRKEQMIASVLNEQDRRTKKK